ncbi:hypothetical protein P171DRAFT_437684 [Karstenula rhodostoma CBS 690.94]|uniref:Uncharacterized protein n=1 Tax=Karstenula rhodostoma CBS 690.94 TaxID=1392251 RepID=A0A9P4P3H4_9PLEO|nr:hypothetical protein P171DRAFT_437684 [Karstenula rhodostoma CBS 690.94]
MPTENYTIDLVQLIKGEKLEGCTQPSEPVTPTTPKKGVPVEGGTQPPGPVAPTTPTTPKKAVPVEGARQPAPWASGPISPDANKKSDIFVAIAILVVVVLFGFYNFGITGKLNISLGLGTPGDLTFPPIDSSPSGKICTSSTETSQSREWYCPDGTIECSNPALFNSMLRGHSLGSQRFRSWYTRMAKDAPNPVDELGAEVIYSNMAKYTEKFGIQIAYLEKELQHARVDIVVIMHGTFDKLGSCENQDAASQQRIITKFMRDVISRWGKYQNNTQPAIGEMQELLRTMVPQWQYAINSVGQFPLAATDDEIAQPKKSGFFAGLLMLFQRQQEDIAVVDDWRSITSDVVPKIHEEMDDLERYKQREENITLQLELERRAVDAGLEIATFDPKHYSDIVWRVGKLVALTDQHQISQ